MLHMSTGRELVAVAATPETDEAIDDEELVVVAVEMAEVAIDFAVVDDEQPLEVEAWREKMGSFAFSTANSISPLKRI